jgi:hypothetical protein
LHFFSNFSPVDVSLLVNEKFIKDDGEKKMNDSFYRSLVGDLLYLTATMQDLMFATSLLFKFMNSLSHF